MAVIKKLSNGRYVQVESITFWWCHQAKAYRYIEQALAGRYDNSDFGHLVTPRIDKPGQHERCHLCA